MHCLNISNPRILLSIVGMALATSLNATPMFLDQYGLIVFDDLDGSSHSQGGAFVGGNITATNSLGFASNAAGPNNHGLAVVGNVQSQNHINIGSGADLVHGGTIPFQNGNPKFNMNGGGQIIYDNTLSMDSTETYLRDVSAYFATLGTSGGSLIENSNNFTFKADLPFSVYNINLEDDIFSDPNKFVSFDIDPDELLVINVEDTEVLWGTAGNWNNFDGNFFNDSFVSSNVLWNFHNATDIEIHREFVGSILAPDADLLNKSTINGGVAVNYMDMDAEVHLPTWGDHFDHYNPTVPEPATVGIISLIGLGGFIFFRRKRSN